MQYLALIGVAIVFFILLGALPTAQVARDRWQQGVQGAGTRWADGINAITDNPLAKAADKKAVWLQRITASADKWEKRLRAVDFATWKRQTVAVGQANYTNGALKGAPKYLAFMDKFLSHLRDGITQVKAMPNGTLQERIARAVFMMNHNHKFQMQ